MKPILLILLTLVLLLPGSAFAACDCSLPEFAAPEQPGVEFWGTVEKSKVLHGDKTTVDFNIHDRFQMPAKGYRRPAASIAFSTRCHEKFQPGTQYWVRAYPCAKHKKLYCSSACAGTRLLARPPREDEHYTGFMQLNNALSSRLQKRVQPAVRECATPFRPALETFIITAGPGDDPYIQESDPSKGTEPACMTAKIFREVVGTHEQPVVISGSATTHRKGIAAGVDVWSCDAAPWACQSFHEVLLAKLLDVVAPPTEQEARMAAKKLHDEEDGDPSVQIAGTLCQFDGLAAAKAFAEKNKLVGGKRWEAELAEMLFFCAIASGEYDDARTYLKGAPLPLLGEAVLDWAAAHPDASLPLRKEGTMFAEAAGVSEDRVALVWLRQAFVRGNRWANEPVWLEALAESILDDPSAPAKLLPLAALAYHKAAMLRPAAAEAYLALARAVVPDEEVAEHVEEIRGRIEAQREANAASAAEAARERQQAQQEQAAAEAASRASNTNTGEARTGETDSMLDWWSLFGSLFAIGAVFGIAVLLLRRNAH